MNELSKFTTIELLKFINDINLNHDNLKKEIINLTVEVDDLENNINEKINQINEKLNQLKEFEENHEILIEEFNKR